MIPSSSRPRVIGIDPSLTATGIASSNGWTQVCGTEGITKLPPPQRMRRMHALKVAIMSYTVPPRPDLVVMEGLDSAQRYGGVNERAWLWWELFGVFRELEIPVVEIQSQRRAIYATGNGNHTAKDLIVAAVKEHWPEWDIRDPKGKADHNLADAVVFMAIGMHLLGHPLKELPDTHTRVLGLLRPQLEGTKWHELSSPPHSPKTTLD